jgi:predicted transcriptional regulator YheO
MNTREITVYGIAIKSFDDAMKAILENAKNELGFTDPRYMSYDDKNQVIKFVVQAGGLSLRNAVNEMAAYLKMSRTSVYKIVNRELNR